MGYEEVHEHEPSAAGGDGGGLTGTVFPGGTPRESNKDPLLSERTALNKCAKECGHYQPGGGAGSDLRGFLAAKPKPSGPPCGLGPQAGDRGKRLLTELKLHS